MTTRGLQPPPSESTRTVQGDHTFLARNLSSDEPAETARGHIAREVAAPEGDDSQLSVCLVGPGWRFTSGISYYTCRLANSMAGDQCDTSVILLRRLLPRLLYPGKARVGLKRASMEYAAGVSGLRRDRLVVGHFPGQGPAVPAHAPAQGAGPAVVDGRHAAHLPAARRGRAPGGDARRHRTARAARPGRGRARGRPRLRPLGAARADPARARRHRPLQVRLAAVRVELRADGHARRPGPARPLRPVPRRAGNVRPGHHGRDFRGAHRAEVRRHGESAVLRPHTSV